MKLTFTLFIVSIFLSITSSAQDWKTVSSTDTAFFGAGSHRAGTSASFSTANLHLLKTIFIDSSSLINGDSNFYFFRTIKNNYRTNCLDTTAPGWLGRKMIRQADGTERYFNSFQDTITINTKAALNDSWLLARDSAGRAFHAVVTQVGIATIDGVTDSIKTISIQAQLNGNPVADAYNSLVLQWSKSHGWTKTLDFYRFPNHFNTTGTEYFGAIVDTGQHVRLDDFKTIKLTALPQRFAPGNEWVLHSMMGYVSGGYGETYEFDSVINVVQLSANSWSVTERKVHFSKQVVPPPGSGQPIITTSYSDTIETNLISNVQSVAAFGRGYRPEVRDSFAAAGILHNSTVGNRYFIDTFCGNYRLYSSRLSGVGEQIAGSGGCLAYNPGVSGFGLSENIALAKFEYSLRSYWDDRPLFIGQPNRYSLNEVSYLKFGTCTMGVKTNVPALDAGPVLSAPDAAFHIFPNPANEQVLITGNSSADATVTLYDMTGRKLLTQVMQRGHLSLSTVNYPSGSYLLEITHSRWQVVKLNIVH